MTFVYCVHDWVVTHMCRVDCFIMHFFSNTYAERYTSPPRCKRCGQQFLEDRPVGVMGVGGE
jgi:hypothetical protein